MKITILTLFPEIFKDSLNFSILKRAQEKKLLELNIVNIRNFALDKHKKVDDHPYGGGVGMILRIDVIDKALQSLKLDKLPTTNYKLKTILLDPRGRLYTQSIAQKYAKLDHLILICGHYEGIDERVTNLVDESISIGDFVLSGGEIPALVMVDSITRLIPQVLSKKTATIDESFQKVKISGKNVRLLSYPQYTRPLVYKDLKVPQILLSGNHAKIKIWRDKKALEITRRNKSYLLK